MNIKESNISSYLQELERVCKSKEFQSKPRMKKFLMYLTTEYIEGRAHKIKGYSIAVDVFDQPDNFDPDLNALVRINAGRLRRLLRLYYLEEGVDNQIKIHIPKGKYVPTFLTNTKPKELNRLVNDRTERTGLKMKPRLAVLPFRNLSEKEGLKFLCFGISQELASSMAKYDDLSIIGTLQRPEQEFIDKAALEYYKSEGVNYLTDGDIAVFGDNLNINVRLIDVKENLRIWGENFKANLEKDDLFDVQTKISSRVASIMGSEYGLINKKKFSLLLASKTDVPSEYMMLLKFYFHETQLTEDSFNNLLESVEKALTQDPDSAIYLAIKANMFGDVYAFGLPGADEAYKIFGELAEKAYTINPYNPFVRVVLAHKCFMYGDKERFCNICDEMVSWMANNPYRLGTLALLICLYGEWEKGKELLDRVLENNIDIPMWLFGATCLYFYRDEEYELALKEANKYQMPNFYWGPLLRAAIHGQLKQKELALKNINKLLEVRPDFKERGRYLMSRYIKEDSLVSHVIEGLAKAGLQVSD